jgi:hypothetical protein
MRTHVRRVSVRLAAYLTNTCSLPRTDQSLRSVRSVLFVWPAPSFCSRTTTTSTGRSTRMSVATRRTRTERRCAEGPHPDALGNFVMLHSTASPPWPVRPRLRRTCCGSLTGARGRGCAALARSTARRRCRDFMQSRPVESAIAEPLRRINSSRASGALRQRTRRPVMTVTREPPEALTTSAFVSPQRAHKA